jgi:hypothetical protein
MLCTLAGATLTLSACTTTHQAALVRVNETASVRSLSRDDYRMLGTAQGHACRTDIAFWPLPLWIQFGGPTGFTVYGWPWNAEEDAWEKAFESAPEADAFLAPRSTKREVFLGWYHDVCFDVRGKAIRMISDDERASVSRAASR